MHKILTLLVLMSTLILGNGCSDPDPVNPSQFDIFVDEILGYYLDGQEDYWFDQNEELLNVYEDAITFHSSDSVSIAYIGFGYGKNDLTAYSVTRPNYGTWEISGNTLTIILENGMSIVWKIRTIQDEIITIQEESSGAIFSMKIIN